jgi:hypothetical protein
LGLHFGAALWGCTQIWLRNSEGYALFFLYIYGKTIYKLPDVIIIGLAVAIPPHYAYG